MIEVLVVDDDIRVAKVNAAYVARVPGFRVTAQAHSAAEALATIEEAGPWTWCCWTTTCPTATAWPWCASCAGAATTPT